MKSDRLLNQRAGRRAPARSVPIGFALAALAEPLPAGRAAVVSWLLPQPMRDPAGQRLPRQLYGSISLFNQGGQPSPIDGAWVSFSP